MRPESRHPAVWRRLAFKASISHLLAIPHVEISNQDQHRPSETARALGSYPDLLSLRKAI